MSEASFHHWFLGAYGENHALVEELVVVASVGRDGADSILLFRHTLMNPWLLTENDDGKNYVDVYFEHLEEVVLELLHDSRSG